MNNFFKVHYETHVHKSDGTYDKMIESGVWEKVNENTYYNCQPFWQNVNKVVSWNLNEIKNAISDRKHFLLGNGVPLEFYMKDGLSHFQRITKVEQINIEK